MSKKANSVAAMRRAIEKTQAQRARDEKKLKRDEREVARLREQVRQIKANAAQHGVDLNALPTKEQARAAAKAEAERKATTSDRRQTAERMAEAISANTFRAPRHVPMRADQPLRSADRLAHEVVLGLDDLYADPSRNALPTGPFLRPTREVVAGQRIGQPLQPQWRTGPAQTRTVSPQATARPSMARPWGAAPGQLGGVKLTDTRGGGR